MRVQSIIRELRGEKIDIIEFSDDPVQFATHALSPAKISRVTVLDPAERHMEVIVDDSQLSLAIGKKGQNVRLAAKLLGWKIDIKSEEEKRQEVQNAIEFLSTGAPVSVLIDYGLAEGTVDALVKGDIGTVEKLGSMTPEQLESIEGIDPDSVNRIQQAINSYYGQEYAEPQAEFVAGESEAETPAGEENAAEHRVAADTNENAGDGDSATMVESAESPESVATGEASATGETEPAPDPVEAEVASVESESGTESTPKL
jgi:transcription termination/antitermination protein NusA